jgi:hypothetical protein
LSEREEFIAERIVGTAYKVHKTYKIIGKGPGFFINFNMPVI